MEELNYFVAKLEKELEDRLKAVASNPGTEHTKAERSLQASLAAYRKLKQHVLTHPFGSKSEEISFFKMVKPRFVAKILYHAKVRDIESKLSEANASMLQEELMKLHDEKDDAAPFLAYYHSGSTNRDFDYFSLSSDQFELREDFSFFDAAPGFSSAMDHAVAKLLSQDLLESYLVEKLQT